MRSHPISRWTRTLVCRVNPYVREARGAQQVARHGWKVCSQSRRAHSCECLSHHRELAVAPHRVAQVKKRGMLHRGFYERHRVFARTHVMRSSPSATSVTPRWYHALHAAHAPQRCDATQRQRDNDRSNSRCGSYGESCRFASAPVAIDHFDESTTLFPHPSIAYPNRHRRAQNLSVICTGKLK